MLTYHFSTGISDNLTIDALRTMSSKLRRTRPGQYTTTSAYSLWSGHKTPVNSSRGGLDTLEQESAVIAWNRGEISHHVLSPGTSFNNSHCDIRDLSESIGYSRTAGTTANNHIIEDKFFRGLSGQGSCFNGRTTEMQQAGCQWKQPVQAYQ